jgi:hypothetical protein
MFVMKRLINEKNFRKSAIHPQQTTGSCSDFQDGNSYAFPPSKKQSLGILKSGGNKKGQEELVGFGIIVAIVMIVLMLFMVFYFSRSKEVSFNSQEVSSFLEASLQTKTTCEDLFEFKSVLDVIVMCDRNERCLNEEDACEIMERYLSEMVKKGFRVEQNYVKGYLLEVYNKEGILFEESFGNKSLNIKSANKEIIRTNGEIILEIFE